MYICAVLSLSPLLQDGNTPLMWAAFFGHEDTVKELLSSGASVHRTNKVNKIANCARRVSTLLTSVFLSCMSADQIVSVFEIFRISLLHVILNFGSAYKESGY